MDAEIVVFAAVQNADRAYGWDLAADLGQWQSGKPGPANAEDRLA